MAVLPPGTLLQLMYLKERLQQVPAGHFVEIGPGSGEITRLLLDLGWRGQSHDLEAATIDRLRSRFAAEIRSGRFNAIHGNYLDSGATSAPRADLVISCMVMEHLESTDEASFMRTSSQRLCDTGMMIGLVPGSPAHWGIEDDIAGHCRRYTQESIRALAQRSRWRVDHVAGLTYPISNLLLPISNHLVNRAERNKLQLSALERTKQSGKRKVMYKTHFPNILGILLNRFTLLPLHLLQKCFKSSSSALVIYFECRPVTVPD